MQGDGARYVKPWAIFASTKERYSGLALRSIPVKTMYDFTVALSSVVHGMLMIACTRDA